MAAGLRINANENIVMLSLQSYKYGSDVSFVAIEM
jgi:hypothetical protein